MKKFIFTGLCMTFFSSLLMAESYRAPKLKLNSSKWQKTQPVKANWDNEYKIQETPQPERNLASKKLKKKSKNSISRGPSSQEEPNKLGNWEYTPEKEVILSPKD